MTLKGVNSFRVIFLVWLNYYLGLFCGRDHIFKQDLKRHCVTTALVGKEELTITGKSRVLKTDVVFIIVTVESYIKFVEAEPFAVFGIALGFFDLSDHSIIHFSLSPFSEE